MKKRRVKRKYLIRRAIAAVLFLFLVILTIFGFKRLTSAKSGSERDMTWKLKAKHALLEQKFLNSRKVSQEEPQESAESVGNKKVYLTFDDGPNDSITPQVLDVLDRYQIKATFFVVGKKVDEFPEILKDVATRGHAIGNHTYTHDYQKIYQNVDVFMEDFYRCEKAIKNVLGEEWNSTLFRFPGGSFEDYKQPMAEHLNSLGYHFYDWNVVNGDGESNDYSVDLMIQKFKESAEGKDTIIVLLHDSEPKQKTVDTLPEIIEWLKSEGYEFYTLNDR